MFEDRMHGTPDFLNRREQRKRQADGELVAGQDAKAAVRQIGHSALQAVRCKRSESAHWGGKVTTRFRVHPFTVDSYWEWFGRRLHERVQLSYPLFPSFPSLGGLLDPGRRALGCHEEVAGPVVG